MERLRGRQSSTLKTLAIFLEFPGFRGSQVINTGLEFGLVAVICMRCLAPPWAMKSTIESFWILPDLDLFLAEPGTAPPRGG